VPAAGSASTSQRLRPHRPRRREHPPPVNRCRHSRPDSPGAACSGSHSSRRCLSASHRLIP
jgi:hypothetical protein